MTSGATGLKGVQNQFDSLVNLFDKLDKVVPKWSIRIKSVVLFVSLVLLLVLSIFIATRLNEFLPIVSAVIMLLLFTMMYRALSFRKRNWSFGIIGAMVFNHLHPGLAALFVTIVSHFYIL
jgi:uncharacterized membrane protein